MEPITAAAAIAKVLTAGHSVWAAYCAKGIDDKELKALSALIGAAEALPGREAHPDGAAQHLALVLAAFGKAYSRAWAGARSVHAGRMRRWFDTVVRERHDDLQARLRTASISPYRPGDRDDDGEGLADLMRDPLAGKAYGALWAAFSDPALTADGEEPPIEYTPEAKQQFERFYRLAWWEGLQSRGGAPVRAFLHAARRDSAAWVHRQIIADMANWDRRHVFGNLREQPGAPGGLPFLALGDMYVEPQAAEVLEDGRSTRRAPIVATLEAWLAADAGPFVTAVRADFGRGKSLTARTLVNRLAQRWLAAAGTPGPELWRPIFVRCADDIIESQQSLESIVKGAIKRHAEDLYLDCGLEHPACGLPDSTAGERVLVVLDGLDEVVLGQEALAGLFKRLKRKAHSRLRFLVLSRPAMLPGKRGLEGARLLDLQAFGDAQIDDWLTRWNEAHGQDITRTAIDERALSELATVPVLLFMIARTWDEESDGQARTRAWLYETFMRQVARGKHEQDRDHHKPVYDAAVDIRDRLVEQGLLTAAASAEDAMLWLLGLLAWRARKKAWRHRLTRRFTPERVAGREAEPLTRRDVGQVLREELNLRRDRVDAVEIGVVLTLQTDPTLGRDHVHFGHKSFSEFLIARYWADRLRRLAVGKERDWPEHETHLLGANLLMHDDRSFELLEEILRGASPHDDSPFAWDTRLRERVQDWAGHCFNDERQDFARPGETAVQDDRRAVLRNAALAIGSRIAWMDGTDGLAARNPQVMRSMLSWFWAAGESVRLIACKADLRGIRPNSKLRHADLRQAKLTAANFYGCDLSYADLSGAVAPGASFRSVKLSGANLNGGDFRATLFVRARLDASSLVGAVLDEADLTSANLIFAHLSGSSLTDVSLQGARLTNTRLDGCTLDPAQVRHAFHNSRTVWPDGFGRPPSL